MIPLHNRVVVWPSPPSSDRLIITPDKYQKRPRRGTIVALSSSNPEELIPGNIVWWEPYRGTPYMDGMDEYHILWTHDIMAIEDGNSQ